VTEAQLQQAVIELARWLGFWVAHFRPAKTERGWRTPVEADGKGFPDLVLAKPGRFLIVELKSSVGGITQEQGAWVNVLRAAGVETHIWLPEHWESGQVEALLRNPAPAE